jgi:hypothetical protein
MITHSTNLGSGLNFVMPKQVHGIKPIPNAKKIKNQHVLCTKFYNKLKSSIWLYMYKIQQLIKTNI